VVMIRGTRKPPSAEVNLNQAPGDEAALANSGPMKT
jgi:hypothetical protein